MQTACTLHEQLDCRDRSCDRRCGYHMGRHPCFKAQVAMQARPGVRAKRKGCATLTPRLPRAVCEPAPQLHRALLRRRPCRSSSTRCRLGPAIVAAPMPVCIAKSDHWAACSSIFASLDTLTPTYKKQLQSESFFKKVKADREEVRQSPSGCSRRCRNILTCPPAPPFAGFDVTLQRTGVIAPYQQAHSASQGGTE